MKLKQCAVSIMSVSVIVVSAGVAIAQDAPLATSARQVLGEAQPVHVRATIVSIDPSSRTLIVRGPRGDATVLVTREVGNFDKLHVGDQVDVLYKNALLVSAQKVKGGGQTTRQRVDTTTYQPTSGASGATGFDATRQVEIVATVESVNAKKRTITLRGPWRTETFDLTPDLAAEKLRKGDIVHAVFTSATAVQVSPAAASK